MSDELSPMAVLDWIDGVWKPDRWQSIAYREANVTHWFKGLPEGTVVLLRAWERSYSISVHLPELTEPYQIISGIPASTPWFGFESFVERLSAKIFEWLPTVTEGETDV